VDGNNGPLATLAKEEFSAARRKIIEGIAGLSGGEAEEEAWRAGREILEARCRSEMGKGGGAKAGLLRCCGEVSQAMDFVLGLDMGSAGMSVEDAAGAVKSFLACAAKHTGGEVVIGDLLEGATKHLKKQTARAEACAAQFTALSALLSSLNLPAATESLL
jgi:hypothetical protein